MSEKRKYSHFYIQNLAQNNMEGGSEGVRRGFAPTFLMNFENDENGGGVRREFAGGSRRFDLSILFWKKRQ